MSKSVKILHGVIHTPPMSKEARLEIGSLLGDLQEGTTLSMPQSRPMPSIGVRCHELRVPDEDANWRVVYFVDTDAIVVLDVFAKKTEQTPKPVIDACKIRLANYLSEKMAIAKAAKQAARKK